MVVLCKGLLQRHVGRQAGSSTRRKHIRRDRGSEAMTKCVLNGCGLSAKWQGCGRLWSACEECCQCMLCARARAVRAVRRVAGPGLERGVCLPHTPLPIGHGSEEC
jgi:hypothetical protein